MALLFFTAAFILLGHRISELFWHSRATAPLSRQERITSSATFTSAFLLAATWSLALAGRLEWHWLLGAAAIALIAALLLPRRSVTLAEEPEPPAAGPLRATILAAFFVPMACWIAFLFWRGYVTPALSHDALVYHLPRAAMFVKSARFEDFHFPDERVDAFPANYELLLADIMILGHDDTVTEWLSTIYFMLFLVAAAAMARRWWGRGRHLYVVVLVLCTAPVLLLQGAAIKNDLIVAYFAIVALLFTGRWLTSRELPSAVLAVIAGIIGVGTKPNGAVIALFVAPVLIAGAVQAMREKRFGVREAGVLIVVFAAGVTLLGGWFYLHLFAHKQEVAAHRVTSVVMQNGYGEWNYLWQVPLVMWLAPFSADNMSAPAPWTGRTWWWPRWDVHDSNFGVLLSLLLLAVPWIIWTWRGQPDRTAARERLVIVIASFLAVAAALPRRVVIYGAVSSYPRYFLFIAVIIVCTVIPPFYSRLERLERTLLLQLLVIALSAAAFVRMAAAVARNDTFTPIGRAVWAAAHPGRRGVPLFPKRGGTVLDGIAGPGDSVDMYCGWDSWTYPVMGRTLQRDLHFINSPAEIRPGAQWVVIDQRRNWGNPAFRDISDWQTYMGHTGPQPEDTAFIETMLHDPGFERIYVDRRNAQAVFHRKSALK